MGRIRNKFPNMVQCFIAQWSRFQTLLRCFVFNSNVHGVTGSISLKALRVIDCMAGTHALSTYRTLLRHPCTFPLRNLGGRGVPLYDVSFIKVYAVTSNSLALFGKCRVYKNTCLE